MSKWIPCKDSLPMLHDNPFGGINCLVTALTPKGQPFVCQMRRVSMVVDGKTINYWQWHSAMCSLKVVAWMPLPEPYKG